MIEAGFCLKCGSPLTVISIEGVDRQACSSEGCDFVYWNNPVPVITAVVEYGDTVVLARNRAWPEKIFSVLTGFLEKDETPEEGALREVKEEIGLDGTIANFLGLYPFFYMNQLLIGYHVIGQGDITLGEEIAEVRLIPVSKLRPWDQATGLAVKDFLKLKGLL